MSHSPVSMPVSMGGEAKQLSYTLRVGEYL